MRLEIAYLSVLPSLHAGSSVSPAAAAKLADAAIDGCEPTAGDTKVKEINVATSLEGATWRGFSALQSGYLTQSTGVGVTTSSGQTSTISASPASLLRRAAALPTRESVTAMIFCLVGFVFGVVVQRLLGNTTSSHSGTEIEDAVSPSLESNPSPRDHSVTDDFAVAIAGNSDKAHHDLVESIWDRFVQVEEPNLFRMKRVTIATDGGMNDIPKLRVKTLRPLTIVATCVFNFALVTYADVCALTNLDDVSHFHPHVLIINVLGRHVLPETSSWHPSNSNMLEKMVPFFELTFLIFFILRLVAHVFIAVMAPRFDVRRGILKKWTYVAGIFWTCIPKITSFSALQLLHYVTPEIVSSDGYLVFLHAYERLQGRAPTAMQKLRIFNALTLFGLLRLVALLFGIDAFLLKFHAASIRIDFVLMDLRAVLNTLSFLWQIMGIVQLRWFVTDRLFIFVFGASDGNLDFDEAAVRDVWQALLCKRVYEHFGVLRGTVVMLGFDDYDFQSLTFCDDEEGIRRRASTRPC